MVKSAFPTQTVSREALLEIQRLPAEMISMENEQFIVRDFRNARFFWLDNEVVDVFLPKIGSTAFSVYSYMCRFVSNETQTCWPSMAQMAERLQLSKSTIHRSLQTLEEFKMIRVVQKGKQHSSSEYQMLDVCAQSSASGTLKASSVPSSVPKQAIQSSATVPEQDLYNNPYKQDLFSPPSSEDLSKNKPKKKKQNNSDPRYEEFVAALSDGYKRRRWDFIFNGADGKQLKSLLAYKRSMTVSEFRKCLRHYFESEGVVPGAMPHTYLMKLPNFWAGPLNQYGKLIENRVTGNSQEMVV